MDKSTRHAKLRDSSDELYRKLGSLSSSFADLEILLINSISLLIDDDYLEIGRIVTANLGYSQNIELFKRLVRAKISDEEALNITEDICTRLRDAGKSRNEYLHSSWGFYFDGSDSPIASKHSVRPGKSSGRYSLHGLDDAIEIIWILFDDLQNFEINYL